MASNPLIGRLEHAGPLSQVERNALQEITLNSRCIPSREDIKITKGIDTIPLVVSGIACRYKLRPDGQRRIVHILLPGDFYDLYSSCYYPSDWHFGALTRCQIVDVQRQALDELAAKHIGIARGLWWATLVELEIEREWLVNDSRPADKRLGHLFCELLVRLQMIGLAPDNSYDLRLSQVDLADAVAISFVHMNRIMQSLRNSQLLQYQRGHIKILNFERLCDYSEFDPSFLHTSKST
ncbi:Crp/Fnr family transcriptional regulator [Methylobacterium frigidaeris]|uniref:HTH crp-type domain-containing protein n=1 Tax=Methylobacterium frigidaeris TaxID=2038277 RepID=A0AA37HKP8_9HYPH|nr:Crp/Fnr family transcriptional regulator [Methylobacterium frigidaeris]GJD66945.1 hypothetical protein MPEAHAMD_7144 [Methylobacterium frigidaeris]